MDAKEILEKRDWKAFERKLANGKSIGQAAEEAGVPIGEAETYCRESLAPRRELEPVALTAASHGAIETALKCLQQNMTSDGVSPGDQIAASGHVLKFAVECQKIAIAARGRERGEATVRDLFDVMGDWKLKLPGV